MDKGITIFSNINATIYPLLDFTMLQTMQSYLFCTENLQDQHYSNHFVNGYPNIQRGCYFISELQIKNHKETSSHLLELLKFLNNKEK
jgi:hypothetical protein